MSKLDGFEFVCCSIRPRIVPSDSIVSSSDGELSTDDESAGSKLQYKNFHTVEGIEEREPVVESYEPYEPHPVPRHRRIEAKQQSSFRSNRKLPYDDLLGHSRETKSEIVNAREPSSTTGMDWLCSKLPVTDLMGRAKPFHADELLRDEKETGRERRKTKPLLKYSFDEDHSSLFCNAESKYSNCFEQLDLDPQRGRKKKEKKRTTSSNPQRNQSIDIDQVISQYSNSTVPTHSKRQAEQVDLDPQRFRKETDKKRTSSSTNPPENHLFEDRTSQFSDSVSKHSRRYEQVDLGPQRCRKEKEKKRSTSKTQHDRLDEDHAALYNDKMRYHNSSHYRFGLKHNRYN
jgi:hypothetical protein